jgi:hypothetical protein
VSVAELLSPGPRGGWELFVGPKQR